MDQPLNSPWRSSSVSLGVESFAHVADHLPDGVALLTTSMRIRYCNDAFASLLGRPVAELHGADLTRFVADTSRADLENLKLATHGLAGQSCDLAWLRPGGTTLRTAARLSPLFTQDGVFDGTMLVASSGSRRDRVDPELEIARRIVASGATLYYRVKIEPGFPLEYLSGNVAQYGYSLGDFTSGRKSWQEVIHREDRARVLGELQRQLDSNAVHYGQEYRMCTASGDTVWMEDHNVVDYGPDGRPSRLEGFMRDVTDRHRSQQDVRRALSQTIRAIGAITSIRDAYTGAHQRRVADLSMAIGRMMGLDAELLEGLYLGALVHDVGKMSIPIDVLSKPSRLTPEEMALMRTHVRAGVELLQDIQLPWRIVDIIAQHHERLDGSGYPGGLGATDILLEARIVSVADVFEAMGEHRPYRAAFGMQGALAELRTHAGTKFDATVVDACVETVAAHGASDSGLWQSLAQRDAEDSTAILGALESARPDAKT